MEAPPEPASAQPKTISWRRNLYAVTVAQALAIIAFSLREPILPFFIKDLGASSMDSATRWAGIVASVGGFTMAFTAPLWGIMGDRYGRKPMLLRSMIAASITIFLMGFATAPWHIAALRLVEGAFTGTVTAATALVATSAPRDRMGYNLGMVQTAVFAGAAFGPAVGGFAAGHFGYRTMFGISSGMMLLAAITVIFFVHEIFTRPVRTKATESDRQARRIWMLSAMMLATMATIFIVRFVSQGIRPIMPLFLQELGSYTDIEAARVSGWMFAVLGISSAASSLIFGRRGDQVGHRKILLGLRHRGRSSLFPDGPCPICLATDRLAGPLWCCSGRNDSGGERDHCRNYSSRSARVHLRDHQHGRLTRVGIRATCCCRP